MNQTAVTANTTKGAIIVAGGIFGFLFGGWTALMTALLVLTLADYATGFVAGWVEGRLSSAVGFKGIAKKVLIFVMVAVAHFVDQSLGQNQMIRDAVIFFYTWNELLSIVENCAKAGLPVPDVLKKAIDILRNKGGDK